MRRLIEIATERRVTIVMFTVAIVLFGMVSLSRLKVNLLPDISYPTVTVRTELTGGKIVRGPSIIRIACATFGSAPVRENTPR